MMGINKILTVVMSERQFLCGARARGGKAHRISALDDCFVLVVTPQAVRDMTLSQGIICSKPSYHRNSKQNRTGARKRFEPKEEGLHTYEVHVIIRLTNYATLPGENYSKQFRTGCDIFLIPKMPSHRCGILCNLWCEW